MGRFLSKITIFIFILSLLVGCSTKPSDDIIRQQIRAYIEDIFKNHNRLSDYFILKDIIIRDKMLEGKNCKVICNYTLLAKRDCPGLSCEFSYYLHTDGKANAGKTIEIQRTFLFEKYEKGWTLSGPAE